jgi:lipoprotein-anchoring transpeptidase ErfK/SrfK
MNDRLANSREAMPNARRSGEMRRGGAGSGMGRQAPGPARSGRRKKGNGILLFPILLMTVGCAVFLFAAWSAVNSPVLASILSRSSAPQQAQRAPSFAHVNIAKPTYTPAAVQPMAQVVLPATFTAIPPTATLEPQPQIAVLPPTDVPAGEPPAAAEPETEIVTAEAVVEGIAYAEIIPDTPTPAYVPPPAAPPKASSGGARWIDVDLSQQRLYAYEGDTLIRSFVVSTGTWQTPTVTGRYKVWIKLRSAPMSGPGYYLPDVPYIMYFYKGYGIHGTYWHNNFGTPMSHGCVNMTIPDAEWVYNFSVVGTVVNVHY